MEYTYQRAAEEGFPCKHGWEVVDAESQVISLKPTAKAAREMSDRLNAKAGNTKPYARIL